jgi:hypothetical protein
MTFCRQSPEVHKGQDTEQNAPVESIEDHYRVNYFRPFIDHIISGYGKSFMYSVFMSLTISDLHYLQGLVPDNCRKKFLSVLGGKSRI